MKGVTAGGGECAFRLAGLQTISFSLLPGVVCMNLQQVAGLTNSSGNLPCPPICVVVEFAIRHGSGLLPALSDRTLVRVRYSKTRLRLNAALGFIKLEKAVGKPPWYLNNLNPEQTSKPERGPKEVEEIRPSTDNAHLNSRPIARRRRNKQMMNARSLDDANCPSIKRTQRHHYAFAKSGWIRRVKSRPVYPSSRHPPSQTPSQLHGSHPSNSSTRQTHPDLAVRYTTAQHKTPSLGSVALTQT